MPRRSAAAILDGLEHEGVRHELAPFRDLLDALGAPERGLRCVLVAGTNGKGAVSALLSAVAAAAGLRTGLYTSPHLERWHERIRIDGDEIAEDRLAALLSESLSTAALRKLPTPTPFEAMTAAALLAFRDDPVDLAVLEVGVGGRLDATNAVEPRLSLITRVALDHRAWLGSDLAAIAREKAGILRPGVPAIVGIQVPSADRALGAEAARIGAPLHRVAEQVAIESSEWRGLEGHRLRLRTPSRTFDLALALAGEHQLANVAHAVRAAELLAAELPAIDDDAIVRGVAACRWPGRLERIALGASDPALVLDAAHNPDGCRALARFLDRLGEPYVLVFGALADKEVADMLPPLARGARAIRLTRPRSARALPPAELEASLPAGRVAEVVDEPLAAVAGAIDDARRLGARHVVVCGSIYLVGEVRARCADLGATSN